MQRALFQWITLATPRIPQLAVAFHPANGGKRDAREAARLNGLGVRPGVPDVLIPWPVTTTFPANIPDLFNEYNGLAIELKSAAGVVSDDQKRWMALLQSAGWSVHVCRSFDAARATIAGYFGVKP